MICVTDLGYTRAVWVPLSKDRFVHHRYLIENSLEEHMFIIGSDHINRIDYRVLPTTEDYQLYVKASLLKFFRRLSG